MAAREEAAIEERIQKLETEKSDLEAKVSRAFQERDFSRAGKLSDDLAKLCRLIDKLYTEWGG